jgi:predicted metal-dependent phosphoesterase TrpH
LGRPQAARCLVAAGHVESVEQAMRQLLGRGCPAYVPRQGLGPFEAIAAVLAAGGVPVLAHFADAQGRRDLIEELVEGGLAGLEVHYRHFDVPTVAGVAALASEMGLLATGGSDYHGDGETYAQVHAELYVPDEDALALYARLGRALPALGASAVP